MTGRASCSAIANVPPRNYGRLLLDQRREKKKSWKMVMWHAWERERARSGVWQTLSARGKHGWKDCCVISFGNLTIERRTFEERKLHTLRKVKLKKKKFLFSRSPCCCLKLVCPSFPNKIWNLLFHERYSNGKKCWKGKRIDMRWLYLMNDREWYIAYFARFRSKLRVKQAENRK